MKNMNNYFITEIILGIEYILTDNNNEIDKYGGYLTNVNNRSELKHNCCNATIYGIINNKNY
jgi:hypothetical protein